jgi:hypothetical protein
LCALSISLEHFKDAIFYGKKGNVTLKKVQTMLRTNELTMSKDMKLEDNGEDSNISKDSGGSQGNQANSKSIDKLNTNASNVIKPFTLRIVTLRCQPKKKKLE